MSNGSLLKGAVAALALTASTLGVAAPAAQAQPYWGPRTYWHPHRYWGPRPYWRPVYAPVPYGRWWWGGRSWAHRTSRCDYTGRCFWRYW